MLCVIRQIPVVYIVLYRRLTGLSISVYRRITRTPYHYSVRQTRRNASETSAFRGLDVMASAPAVSVNLSCYFHKATYWRSVLYSEMETTFVSCLLAWQVRELRLLCHQCSGRDYESFGCGGSRSPVFFKVTR